MSKQCTCGRSASYPYCDNTHLVKARVIQNINEKTFNYLQKEYGNQVVEINRFVSKELSFDFIKEFDDNKNWEDVAFINAKVLTEENIPHSLKEDWDKIKNSIQKSVEIIYNKKVRLQTIYIQKWEKDGEGIRHSDIRNLDGTPGNITYKIATTLFLHKDFVGGQVKFYNKEMKIEPKHGSIYIFNGGLNEHEVLKVEDGTRYTIISFWDYEDSEYTEIELKAMELNQEAWSKHIKEQNNNGAH